NELTGGQSWQPVIHWHACDETGKDIWRSLKLHVTATGCSGNVHLQSNVAACFSAKQPVEPSCDGDSTKLMANMASGLAVSLTPRFDAADPLQFPKCESHVV